MDFDFTLVEIDNSPNQFPGYKTLAEMLQEDLQRPPLYTGKDMEDELESFPLQEVFGPQTTAEKSKWPQISRGISQVEQTMEENPYFEVPWP